MRGVVYVAYGEPAIACLYESLAALRLHEPDLSAIAISDRKLRQVETVVKGADDLGARSVKLALYDLVPREWNQALYLDADIVPLLPLSRFFEPLDFGWELVFCQDDFTPVLRHCRLKVRQEKKFNVKHLGTDNVTQFAGGAFAWRRCPATEKFFKNWQQEWNRYRYRDQGALVRALAGTPVKLWPLGARANWSTKDGAAELWHQHGKARRRGAQ